MPERLEHPEHLEHLEHPEHPEHPEHLRQHQRRSKVVAILGGISIVVDIPPTMRRWTL